LEWAVEIGFAGLGDCGVVKKADELNPGKNLVGQYPEVGEEN